MFHFIELVIALSIIMIIAPQTPTENVVLRKVVDTGLFPNYRKAKEFLTQLTWLLIFAFLFLLFLLNLHT
jgi:preprotein translocase subunit SecG